MCNRRPGFGDPRRAQEGSASGVEIKFNGVNRGEGEGARGRGDGRHVEWTRDKRARERGSGVDVHAPLNNVIAGLLAYRWLTSSNRPLPAGPSRLGCRNVSGTPLGSTRRRKEKEESLEERKSRTKEQNGEKWRKKERRRDVITIIEKYSNGQKQISFKKQRGAQKSFQSLKKLYKKNLYIGKSMEIFEREEKNGRRRNEKRESRGEERMTRAMGRKMGNTKKKKKW